jgi:predicted solute-binding protein
VTDAVAPHARGGRIRLAAVSYVNAWPLLEGLERRPDVELVQAIPARVAALLAAGEADAGLVPSIELSRIPGLAPLAGLCISAHGPVDSVLLLLRRAPHAVRTVALDPASRTSQVLAMLVLDGLFGAKPDAREADPVEAWREGRDDAVLVIGDRALEMRAVGAPALDLADAWTRMTGLPFVFAVWGARPGVALDHPELEPMLRAAWALSSIDAIARRAAVRGPLDEAGFRVYLTRRIRYGLGEPELRGLRRFLHMARSVRVPDGGRCST